MRKINYVFLTVALISLPSCFGAVKRAQWHEKHGENLLEAQKYKRAARHLEKAQKAGVSDAKSLFTLGSAYLYLGRYKEASEHLEKAAETDPKNPDLWFRLGNAYFNRNEFDKAASAYRNTIKLRPDYLEAIEALAVLYPDGGVTKEEALKMWKKALEMEKREEWITRAQHYIEQLENEGTQ